MIFSSSNKLLAVADGHVISLNEISGDGQDDMSEIPPGSGGFAVEPVSGTIYSPVSGRIESVADSGQSYSIRADDGLDLLVRIGNEKIDLGGKGFISLVEQGDVVRAGDVIAKADISLLKLKGYSVTTPVLITNHDELREFDVRLGWVRGGRSAVATYKK